MLGVRMLAGFISKPRLTFCPSQSKAYSLQAEYMSPIRAIACNF